MSQAIIYQVIIFETIIKAPSYENIYHLFFCLYMHLPCAHTGTNDCRGIRYNPRHFIRNLSLHKSQGMEVYHQSQT